MKRSGKKFTEEFRKEAVRLVQTSGKSSAEIARDLGVGVSTLGKWCKLYGPPPEPADAKTLAEANEVNKALRREVEILRQEREILKKAATFFAKEPR